MYEDLSLDLFKCSFCGKTELMVRRLIPAALSDTDKICDECVKSFTKELFMELGIESFQDTMKPRAIEHALNRHVIGQDVSPDCLGFLLHSWVWRRDDEVLYGAPPWVKALVYTGMLIWALLHGVELNHAYFYFQF